MTMLVLDFKAGTSGSKRCAVQPMLQLPRQICYLRSNKFTGALMPPETPPTKPLLTAAEIAAGPSAHIKHPWNPNSSIHITRLSAAAGLARTVISLARVPPGKESFVYHSHEHDEEWLFILSGKGRAEIDGKYYEVGPGDFMGFTAPGPAHHLTNPYTEDLVYLMGGEHSGLDIGHFPKLGRKMVFGPSGIFAMNDRDLTEMSFSDYVAKDGETN
jgi:uncharacterized cupin superfamily protein